MDSAAHHTLEWTAGNEDPSVQEVAITLLVKVMVRCFRLEHGSLHIAFRAFAPLEALPCV
jgi:hypothetical protein